MFGKMQLNENSLSCYKKKLIGKLKAALSHVCYYPDPHAMDLKNLLSKKFFLSPDHFFITNGSDEALLTIGLILKECDTIITTRNTFNAYKNLALIFDKKLIEFSLINYKIPVEKICNSMKKNTLIMISNPHNPTGTYINKDELKQLISSAKKHQAYLVIDEAYYEFAAHGSNDYTSAINFLDCSRLIVLRTFSKFFGLAGLRCGYIISNPDLISRFSLIKKVLVYNVNSLALIAAEYILKKEISKFNALTYKRIDNLKKDFYVFCEKNGIKYVFSCTNFVMIHVKNSENLYNLLRKNGIDVKECSCFGLLNHIRVSLSTKKDLNVLKRTIQNYLNSLKL